MWIKAKSNIKKNGDALVIECLRHTSFRKIHEETMREAADREEKRIGWGAIPRGFTVDDFKSEAAS